MSENDFHARGAKDRLSGKTFRYFSELVTNQRNSLRELNKSHHVLLSKHNLLKMDFDDLQSDYDKLKQRVGSAPKIKEGSAEECMLMSEDTLAKDWGEKSPKAMIADLSEDELQRLTMAIHGKINTIIPARINGMTIREVMNALVELTPEEMDGNQTP